MKKSDIKILKDGNLKFVSVYVVRVRMIDKERTNDLMMYFDEDKANSLCQSLLSRYNNIESAYVVERNVFL